MPRVQSTVGGLPSRLRLIATVLTILTTGASQSLAQCAVTAGGSVTCTANTTTTATTNTNGATASSSDQIQLWNNGTAITGAVNGGVTIGGFGLALEETGGAAAGISLTNNAGAAITTSAGGNPALQLIGNGGAIAYSGNGSITSTTGAGLVVSNTGAGTIDITTGGSISGGGGANAITFTGGTDTLTLQTGFSLTGNIGNGATSLTFSQASGITVPNVISGAGAVIQAGPGTLTLTGANTYSGATTVNGGTLAIGGGGSIATSSGVTLAGGAVFDISSAGGGQTIQGLSGSLGSIVSLGSNTLTVGVASGADTYSGALQNGGIGGGGGGSLTKSGAGTLLLTQVNPYTGATTISGGTLALTGTGAVAASSGVALTAVGANFDISFTSAGASVLGLTGVVGSTVSLGNQALTVAVAAGTNTFSGILQDGGIGGGTGGSLIKSGAGTLLLTQANAYTGSTTVSGGTLALTGTGSVATSSGVALTSGSSIFDISFTTGTTVSGLTGVASSTVDLGGQTLTVNQASGSGTFAGVIADGGIGGGAGGALVKSGAGTLVLSGTNTYSGGTTVNGGVLSISSPANLGTGSTLALNSGSLGVTANATFPLAVTVTGNSGFNIATGTTTTWSGVIANGATAGALSVSGGGTMILTAANTYSGGTTIAATTLQIGAGGVTGGITGNVTDNGSLVFNRSNTVTFPGAVSGSGSLTQAGSGTLILTGANTYGGSTTISAGTLQIGSGGTAGSVSGNITDNSALVFNRSDAVTYAGNITGTGSLTQAGSGTLIVTGTNNFSGGTSINAGTLEIGPNGSIAGNIADNSSLIFNSSGTLTFAGAISGSGALAQAGSGTLILDGNSMGFSGATTVSSGILEVGDASNPGAALGGNVTVSAGATLMGHGTIVGSVVNNGTVQPGGTVGVLTLNGNYSQASSGTLTIEITPNVAAGPGIGYDQLRIGGTATLAGALSILDDPGSYLVGSRYTILTAAGGRSGTFATVAFNPTFAPFISPDVSYDANDVFLTLDPTPNPIPSAPPPLFNGGQQVPDELTAMVSAMEGVGDAVLGDVCGAAAQRIAGQGQGCMVRPEGAGYRIEVWARGLGGIGNLSGSGARFSFHDDYAGALVGTGIGWGGFTVGFGGGYLMTGENFADGSNASQNAGLGFVYGRYTQGPLWLGVMGAYGGGQVNGNRALPGTGLTASGSRGGNFGIVEARAAYDIPLGAFTVEPRASLSYIHAGQASFAESGAGLLDLGYSGTNADVTEGRLVARVMRAFAVGTWALTPWVEAGVQQTFSGLSRGVAMVAGTIAGTAAGISPAPTAAVVGIGVDAEVTQALAIYAAYQGLFSANQAGNAFTAGLQFRF